MSNPAANGFSPEVAVPAPFGQGSRRFISIPTRQILGETS
jgi:hypothetical protein